MAFLLTKTRFLLKKILKSWEIHTQKFNFSIQALNDNAKVSIQFTKQIHDIIDETSYWVLYPFTEEAITGSQVASIDDIKHYNLVAIVKTTITNRGLKRILSE